MRARMSFIWADMSDTRMDVAAACVSSCRDRRCLLTPAGFGLWRCCPASARWWRDLKLWLTVRPGWDAMLL